MTDNTHPVKLTWARNPQWHKITAWTIEHFGLPGDRYMTEPDEDCMTWHFVSKQDQLLFVIAWGNDQ